MARAKSKERMEEDRGKQRELGKKFTNKEKKGKKKQKEAKNETTAKCNGKGMKWAARHVPSQMPACHSVELIRQNKFSFVFYHNCLRQSDDSCPRCRVVGEDNRENSSGPTGNLTKCRAHLVVFIYGKRNENLKTETGVI